MPAEISVVIPALNAAETLPATVASVRDVGPVREVVVVDGGSADETRSVARRAGAWVVSAPRGRGTQLAAGADAASGPWLLFLHADTVLSPDWADAAAEFMRLPGNSQRAAVFTLRLDDPARAARRLEALVRWRTRVLRLPYGDQGLLIRRDRYEALGGFPPLSLMEDVAFIRRLGRRNLAFLPATATTSAQRFLRSGYLWRSLRNLACLTLYFLGAPPGLIRRIYG